MKPIINTEERIGKTVGRRVPPRDALAIAGGTKADKDAWRKSGLTVGVPKGVYRFRTHEEADEWLIKMQTRRHPAS